MKIEGFSIDSTFFYYILLFVKYDLIKQIVNIVNYKKLHLAISFVYLMLPLSKKFYLYTLKIVK